MVAISQNNDPISKSAATLYHKLIHQYPRSTDEPKILRHFIYYIDKSNSHQKNIPFLNTKKVSDFLDACCQIFDTASSFDDVKKRTESAIRYIDPFPSALQYLETMMSQVHLKLAKYPQCLSTIVLYLVQINLQKHTSSNIKILRFCYFLHFVIELLDSQFLPQTWEKQIISKTKGLNLFESPKATLHALCQEIDSKLKDKDLRPGLKRGILRLYLRQVRKESKNTTDVELLTSCHLAEKIIEVLDFDLPYDECAHTIEDLKTELQQFFSPFSIDLSPLEKFDELYDELDQDVNDNCLSRSQQMQKYKLQIQKWHQQGEDPEKLYILTLRCLEVLNDGFHLSDWCFKQVDDLIQQLKLKLY